MCNGGDYKSRRALRWAGVARHAGSCSPPGARPGRSVRGRALPPVGGRSRRLPHGGGSGADGRAGAGVSALPRLHRRPEAAGRGDQGGPGEGFPGERRAPVPCPVSPPPPSFSRRGAGTPAGRTQVPGQAAGRPPRLSCGDSGEEKRDRAAALSRVGRRGPAAPPRRRDPPAWRWPGAAARAGRRSVCSASRRGTGGRRRGRGRGDGQGLHLLVWLPSRGPQLPARSPTGRRSARPVRGPHVPAGNHQRILRSVGRVNGGDARRRRQRRLFARIFSQA